MTKVLPERLKLLKSKKMDESKEDKDEKKDIPDVSVNKDVLTVDIDKPEGDKEPTDEDPCEKFDNKLKDLLVKFLDTQELEAESEEEKDLFVKLFHETFPELDCYVEKHDDIDDKTKDNDTDLIVANDDGTEENVELLEQLKDALKENKTLKEKLRSSQVEKAVGNSKVVKLNEELNQFKNIAALAGKKALSIKNFESENAQLKETLKAKDNKLSEALKDSDKQKSLNKKIQEELDSKNKENSDLREKIKASKKLEENYQKSIKLIEKYKNFAYGIANRYIDNKALSLGISSNEIKNRLNESYTLDEVDKVCEELEKYSIKMSKLPFQFDKPNSSVRARLREDRSSDPLKNIDSEYDDTVDDYLLELAGLKK